MLCRSEPVAEIISSLELEIMTLATLSSLKVCCFQLPNVWQYFFPLSVVSLEKNWEHGWWWFGRRQVRLIEILTSANSARDILSSIGLKIV